MYTTGVFKCAKDELINTDDTHADQICTSTNRLVHSSKNNKHSNDRVMRLNLLYVKGGGGSKLILDDLQL